MFVLTSSLNLQTTSNFRFVRPLLQASSLSLKMQNPQMPSTAMDAVGTELKFVSTARRFIWPCDGLARVLGLVFTLAAAIVVAADNETKTISVSFIKGLPPLHFRATAKWQYMSAFQYFVASNGIACSYAAISLVFSVVTKGYKNNAKRTLLLMSFDLIIMGLLFSADGAAAAIGVIGRDGNKHMEWMQVCGYFEGYCNHFTASLVISITGSFMFLWLVVLSVLNLYQELKFAD